MQYLSPAYKVMFVLVTAVNVSPKEPDDALFGRDVKTWKKHNDISIYLRQTPKLWLAKRKYGWLLGYLMIWVEQR